MPAGATFGSAINNLFLELFTSSNELNFFSEETITSELYANVEIESYLIIFISFMT